MNDGWPYESNASGRSEVYVRPYPDGSAGQWQVSTSGGAHARWSRDSRELFFAGGGAVMGVRVEPGAAWAASVPQPIVKGRYVLDAVSPFDVSIDGTRFVLIKEAASAAESTGPALWSWSTGRRS
jgi:serine/threonine-protein kinase